MEIVLQNCSSGDLNLMFCEIRLILGKCELSARVYKAVARPGSSGRTASGENVDLSCAFCFTLIFNQNLQN